MNLPAPEVNEVDGLVDFLRRWQSREEENRAAVPLRTSENGNINVEGSPQSYSSAIFTRWHASFTDSLEPGVRELVLALIEAWDCITYSSCEGHRSIAGTPWRPRHVRMASRSSAEDQRIGSALDQLVTRTNAPHCGGPGPVLVQRRSTIVGDAGLEMPGWDLVFASTSSDEDGYWASLEPVYRTCLLAVEESRQRFLAGDMNSPRRGPEARGRRRGE
jgi:hypothetical protein